MSISFARGLRLDRKEQGQAGNNMHQVVLRIRF